MKTGMADWASTWYTKDETLFNDGKYEEAIEAWDPDIRVRSRLRSGLV